MHFCTFLYYLYYSSRGIVNIPSYACTYKRDEICIFSNVAYKNDWIKITVNSALYFYSRYSAHFCTLYTIETIYINSCTFIFSKKIIRIAYTVSIVQGYQL